MNLQDLQALQEQNFIEITLIDKIKKDLKAYQEKDENFSNANGSIKLTYDGSIATIHFQGEKCYVATLFYDDFSYTVEDYYYSEVESCIET